MSSMIHCRCSLLNLKWLARQQHSPSIFQSLSSCSYLFLNQSYLTQGKVQSLQISASSSCISICLNSLVANSSQLGSVYLPPPLPDQVMMCAWVHKCSLFHQSLLVHLSSHSGSGAPREGFCQQLVNSREKNHCPCFLGLDDGEIAPIHTPILTAILPRTLLPHDTFLGEKHPRWLVWEEHCGGERKPWTSWFCLGKGSKHVLAEPHEQQYLWENRGKAVGGDDHSSVLKCQNKIKSLCLDSKSATGNTRATCPFYDELQI